MHFLNNTTLKLFAIFLMVLDHVYTYIGLYTGIEIPIWFGYLGRLVSPIFFFLLVEGFFHTRSRKKYAYRLFGMSAIMLCFNMLLGFHNNIFLSLAFGVVLMMLLTQCKTSTGIQRIGYLVGAMLCGVVMMFFTEASIYGLCMTLIFYLLHDKKVAMPLTYIGFSLLGLVSALLAGGGIESVLIFDYQWMMVFAILPILCYNGSLGYSNKWVKGFFYWFYPLHLVILVALSQYIGETNPAYPLQVGENLLQEVVHQIEPTIDFKNDKTLILSLSESNYQFQGVYLIELYEADSHLETLRGTLQFPRPVSSTQQTLKVLQGATLKQGHPYVLVLKDLVTDTPLFEDVAYLN